MATNTHFCGYEKWDYGDDIGVFWWLPGGQFFQTPDGRLTLIPAGPTPKNVMIKKGQIHNGTVPDYWVVTPDGGVAFSRDGKFQLAKLQSNTNGTSFPSQLPKWVDGQNLNDPVNCTGNPTNGYDVVNGACTAVTAVAPNYPTNAACCQANPSAGNCGGSGPSSGSNRIIILVTTVAIALAVVGFIVAEILRKRRKRGSAAKLRSSAK